MRKKLTRRSLILAISALILVIAPTALYFLRPSLVPNPIYQGKHLSEWMKSGKAFFGGSTTGNGLPHLNATVLLVSNVPKSSAATGPGFQVFDMPLLDSNAVPMLLQILNRQDSAAQNFYATLHAHLPQFLQSRLPLPGYPADARGAAAVLIARYPFAARPAIPALIHMTKDNRRGLPLSATWALGEIGDNSPSVINALNQCFLATNANLLLKNQYVSNALQKLTNHPAPTSSP